MTKETYRKAEAIIIARFIQEDAQASSPSVDGIPMEKLLKGIRHQKQVAAMFTHIHDVDTWCCVSSIDKCKRYYTVRGKPFSKIYSKNIHKERYMDKEDWNILIKYVNNRKWHLKNCEKN